MLTPKKITKKDVMEDLRFLRNQKESKAPTQLARLKAAAKGAKNTIQKVKRGGTIKSKTVVKKRRPVRKMAEGGTSNPCPEGYYWAEDGSCQPQAGKPGLLSGNSAKLGLGILGAMGSAMGAIGSVKRIKRQADREAADRVVDTTMNTINAPMKKGGTVKKGMGFKVAQKMIMKKQGLSKKGAGAILASGARKASPAAKRKNPNLKKVKTSKK
jgi:hypothetical protein